MVYNTDNQLIIDTISVLQFHKGTIKTLEPSLATYTRVDNFNSIKVQLKHEVYLWAQGTDLFQFHKGTIKTSGRFYI